MVQITKQAVQQWMMIDSLAQKYRYEEKIAQLEKKYGMTFAEFDDHINTTEKEVFDEWDDNINWGAYVGFLEEINQKISEIKAGNFQLVD